MRPVWSSVTVTTVEELKQASNEKTGELHVTGELAGKLKKAQKVQPWVLLRWRLSLPLPQLQSRP
ncbi:protein of unknown function [Paraburkholderia kururiensis]